MKCFNHHDRDAFGICKTCGKALCLECMSKNSDNVVCANNLKCQMLAKQNDALVGNANKLYSKENIGRYKLVGIGYLLIGITFAVVCIMTNFSIIIGSIAVIFIMLGVISLKNTSRLVATDEDSVNKK